MKIKIPAKKSKLEKRLEKIVFYLVLPIILVQIFIDKVIEYFSSVEIEYENEDDENGVK